MLVAHLLDRERNQLIAYWSRLFGLHVGRFLKSKPFARLHTHSNSSTDDVRKVHDAFGWCAKKPKVCAGAIYRTRAFIELEPSLRDASRPRGVSRKDWPRNIHIEHTVLASQLHETWRKSTSRSEIETAVFFISKGVTTAMHVDEESALARETRALNPCFDERALPFQRYHDLDEKFEIWNVLSRQKINTRNFTFADHQSIICELLSLANAPGEWREQLISR